MRKGARRHFSWHIRQVRSFAPIWVRKSFPRELSGELLSEIEDREANLGRELDRADLTAFLKTKPSAMGQAMGFWPQAPWIRPEILPASFRSLELCTVGFFLPELLWLALVVMWYCLNYGEFPGSKALGALQMLVVISASALSSLVLVSIAYPLLKNLRPERMSP